MKKDPVQDLRDYEMVDVDAPGSTGRIKPWDRFVLPNQYVPGVISDQLSINDAKAKAGVPDDEGQWVTLYQEAFALLSQLPTAELERLFTESLDATSYRLDAWMTSLVTKRLFDLRGRQGSRGTYVGGFAWVENLRPAASNTITLPDGSQAHTTFGGYVHAPSMAHAATAAVLRNGFLTHAGAADSPYAIDMSSAQVRKARFVLDSVRNGQPVGAVLGYQIERGLHEVEAEYLIDPLRRVAPLVANKSGTTTDTPDLVAARNVVDGLALRARWKANTLYGPGGIGTLSAADRDKLEGQLAALDRSIDAVADLLLAESVHQLIRGSTSASGAGLDALAQGVRPPEPEVGRMPTGGTSLTHRLALVLGAPASSSPGGSWATTPRALAEPRLDAWVGQLLGNPQNVVCAVQYPGKPTATEPSPTRTVTVTFGQLALAPLDVLALAKSVATTAAASELDRRVLYAAFADQLPVDAADEASFSVVYTAPAGVDRDKTRTIPELLEVASAIAQLLGGARPLRPTDLVLPENASKVRGISLKVADSAASALQGLQTLQTDLAQKVADAQASASADRLAALRAPLRTAASYGIAGAFPPFVAGDQEGRIAPDPLSQAVSVLDEVNRRVAAALAVTGDAADWAQDEMRAIFGRDFLLLQPFAMSSVGVAGTDAAADAAAAADELARALDYGPQLTGGDPRAVRRWLQQAARVREPVGRWRKLRMVAEASGAEPAKIELAQLPHVDRARWVGLPLKSDETRPSGRVSIALHRPAPSGQSVPKVGDDWYGLALDEWAEMIPNASESTGVSFRYEDSGGEAAQAILIAVPPDPAAATWTFDTIAAVLNDTLDWARTRGCDDVVAGDAMGQLAPGNFLACNGGDDTISTTVTELVAENVIR